MQYEANSNFLPAPPGTLEKLFPFHIAFDSSGMVVSSGKSVCDRCIGIVGSPIGSFFRIKNPPIGFTIQEIKSHLDYLILLEHAEGHCRIRGQFVILNDDLVVYVGSPWLSSADELVPLGLTFDDFALHDSTIDLLQVLQSSKMAINDSNELNRRLIEKNNKLAEREFQLNATLTGLERLADGVFIFSRDDFKIRFLNHHAAEMAESGRNQLINTSFLDLKNLFNLEEMESDIRRLKVLDPVVEHNPNHNGQFNLSINKTHHFKIGSGTSGRQVAINIRLSAFRTFDGKTEVFAILRDVSDMELSERQSRMTQRLESIGLLAAGLAHDLKNSLAPILMSLDIIRSHYDGDPAMIDTIMASAERASGMVKQLLTFARGSDGARVAVQLVHVVKEIQGIIQNSFPKNIDIHLRWDKKLPFVMGDATQLHQVLLNLCVNARDAMPDGGSLALEVKTEYVDSYHAGVSTELKPGKYVVVNVKDTGTGIPANILDNIYDPFFTTKESDKGTGLGLSTSIGIIRSHGGFINVHSEPGVGSLFSVYLPAQESAVFEQASTRYSEICKGHGETILLVDDEESIRTVGSAILKRLNFKPLLANDGVEGVMQVAMHKEEINSVIVDMNMPNMNGIQFVKAVRKLMPNLPVVVATGSMNECNNVELNSLEVSSILEKPFTEAQLSETLSKILASQQKSTLFDPERMKAVKED